MLIYAIRHGESTANQAGVHAGWSPVPLTEEGRRMAQALRPRLESIPFDRVYASDLPRALQTAQLTLPGRKIIPDERLREIHVGSLAGVSPQDLGQRLGESYWQSIRQRDFTAYGGENTHQQQERVQAFLNELACDSEETVAVFCHEGTIKCMLNCVLEATLDWKMTALANCSFSVFQLNPQRPWKLICWNQT